MDINSLLIFLLALCVGYIATTYAAVDCVLCKYFKRKERTIGVSWDIPDQSIIKKEIKMPMKKGKSNKVISENIKEGMDSYKKKGTFGNSKPKNAKAAQKQIIAAAYSNAGRSKSKGKKKK